MIYVFEKFILEILLWKACSETYFMYDESLFKKISETQNLEVTFTKGKMAF